MDHASATSTMLTRAQVAQRLGVSVSTVRRMEFDRLHPVQDADGIWRFDPAELEGIEPKAPPATPADVVGTLEARANARKGRLAARVFRMFARHVSLPQIVVATGQPPEVVRALYHEWSTSLEQGEWERRSAMK